MRSILIDILPEAGHVRITYRLSTLLNEKGHEVYYTDSSDSVFTSGLIREGIGRIIYPTDFRWFTPDMVVLDSQLYDKAWFYKQCNIRFVYAATQVLGNLRENIDAPVIYLPPMGYAVQASSNRMSNLMELISQWKADPSQVVIVGLLEEEPYTRSLQHFYEIIRQQCAVNTKYQLLLLTNSHKTVEQFFPLPDNVILYRLLDLPALLPYCDVALTTGRLNTLIECIHAHLPAITYPVDGDETLRSYAEEYTRLGLGVCGELHQITPYTFDQQIAEVMNNKTQMQERSRQLWGVFETENEKLEQVADRLISMIDDGYR